MSKIKSAISRSLTPEKGVGAFFFLLLIAMSIELYTNGLAQKLFYFSGYISVIFIAYALIKNRQLLSTLRPALPFLMALFIIGLVRYGWFLYAKTDTSQFSEFDLNNLRNYDLGGKRFLLSAFILSVAIVFSKHLTDKVIASGRIIVLAGLVISLVYGMYEFYYVTHERIKLTADAASSSSYMVLFMYTTYLTLSKDAVRSKNLIVDIFAAVITFALLMLCDTRVSILAFIGVTTIYCLYNKSLRSCVRNKFFVGGFVGLIIVVISLTGNRWIDGIHNIQNYKTDSSTSLGARVAIWDSGLTYIDKHYGFSTPQERTAYAQAFIKENHPGNTEGYNNVKYNMHNDFLETLTLQGIIGVISLAFIYIAFAIVAIRHRIMTSVLLPLFVLFVCGLTDSVLINSQTVMLFLISVIISASLPVSNK
ncbi:O-antigen ligase family protein [Klebsiella oxytoca]|uniref:O-antigen ligase-related domain-containing protein n=1 Tax=Klebsiella oxytoca TaxID=571 RepID=A0A6B8N3D3_KLEOX|nr:O-antigen ligase family protein [Klebsiella oxytoca]QGN40288.1 hypothetical protein GJ746_24540 [Klebsiella oxytoca]